MNPEELHNIFHAEKEFWWYVGMRAVTAAVLDRQLGGGGRRGLDVGCGTGYNAPLFEKQYDLRMFAIDSELLAVSYCRETGVHRSFVASILDLPFRNESFDFVSTLDVISGLGAGNDRRALLELLRIVAPGGTLLIRVPALRAFYSRHSQWVSDVHRYRVGELIQLLEGQDCRVVRWTYANFFLAPVAWLKFRIWENIRREQPKSGVMATPPTWLNALLTTVLTLEAAMIRRGLRLPFGLSLFLVVQKSHPGMQAS